MSLFADMLKEIVSDFKGSYANSDDMARSPSELGTESADQNSITPSQMIKQRDATSTDTTMSDSGRITGFNEFADTPLGKALAAGKGGEGTLTGFLKKLNADPNATVEDVSPQKQAEKDASGAGTLMGFLKNYYMKDQPLLQPGAGTVGGGVGSDHTPGTQQDPALNPTPTAKQRIGRLAQVDPNNRDLDGNPAGVSKASKPNQGVLPPMVPGNIDLSTRPQVTNPDGSVSTVLTKSFNFDGREVLLPTISDDGRKLNDNEAIQQYRQTGKHLGIYANPESANAYGNIIHKQQESAMKYAQPTALDPQQIEELRQSLLTDAGQRDPNNPNGLAGRMSSPYSQIDQQAQMEQGSEISDTLNQKKANANADRRNMKGQ